MPGVLMGSLLSSITKIPHKVIILISEDRFPFLLFKKKFFLMWTIFSLYGICYNIASVGFFDHTPYGILVP